MSKYNYIKKMTPTLDKKHKFMFFEIKKAGITSLRRGALKGRALIYKELLEDYYNIFDSYSNNDIDNMFKFTIVRNPFDRVVSAFFYLQERDQIERKLKFKKFIKTKFRQIVINDITTTEFHFHPMFERLFFKGKIIVDFVGRLENIKKDWKYIASKIGTSTKFPHINRSKHSHYRKYYDSDCIEIVSDIYKKDLDYFNYTF